MIKNLSLICFALGFVSIGLSLVIWFYVKNYGGPIEAVFADPATDPSARAAHAERWGIFVGLWAPTFFLMSERLETLFGNKK